VKELEATITIRNNRLKERRLALGLTQQELAKRAGISYPTYNALETMRLSPLCSQRYSPGARWKPSAMALAAFHRVRESELFPHAVLSVTTTSATRRVNAADLVLMLQPATPESPSAAMDRAELRAALSDALTCLPRAPSEALRLRFMEDLPVAAIAERLGVSRQAAYRRIDAGLRGLRDPEVAPALSPWLEGRVDP
jgi:transcriptional regulator with XRE-family HTH domain